MKNQNGILLTLSRQVKTGLLGIGAILLFIFGYSFLQGINLFDKQRTFYVIYNNVEGLVKTAPVTINGLKVGTVQDISFADADGLLLVTFTVDSDFEFSKTSKVKIYSSGFIGGNNLAIVPEYSPSNLAVSGDTLQGEIQKGILDAVTEKLGPLELKVENTLSYLDSLLLNLNSILDTSTQANLKQTIASLNTTVNTLSETTSTVNRWLTNSETDMQNAVSNISRMSNNFATLSDSLSQINTQQLAQSINSITTQLDAVLTGLETGEGSLGKLLQDETLYNNLSGASAQLEALLKDLKENPKRYVHFSLFGKKAKPYQEANKEANKETNKENNTP